MEAKGEKEREQQFVVSLFVVPLVHSKGSKVPTNCSLRMASPLQDTPRSRSQWDQVTGSVEILGL